MKKGAFYHQAHDMFDQQQEKGTLFLCRIRAKPAIEAHLVEPGSIVLYDVVLLLGTDEISTAKKLFHLVGYEKDT